MSNSSSFVFRRRAPVSKDMCPMALAAEMLGDRWVLLILREAFYGVVRFDDMLRDLGIPRSTLTDRLTKLIRCGLIVQQPYREPGHRVRQAYVLSDAGRALGLTMMALSEWGEAHLLEGASPIGFVDKESGSYLKTALVNEEGIVVPAENAQLQRREGKIDST